MIIDLGGPLFSAAFETIKSFTREVSETKKNGFLPPLNPDINKKLTHGRVKFISGQCPSIKPHTPCHPDIPVIH